MPGFAVSAPRSLTQQPIARVENAFISLITQLALADAASLEAILVTGAIPPDMFVEAETTGDLTFASFEDTTVSANGAAQAIADLNRRDSLVPQSATFLGPTITGDGTPILTGIILAGSNRRDKNQGGELSVPAAWLLKPNTIYLFRLTNNTGSPQDVQLRISWVEVGTQ